MKLYLETTLFNYYFDVEREGDVDTIHLFEKIRAGDYEAYSSNFTMGELLKAPGPKQSKMFALVDEYNISILPVTAEVTRLTSHYISEGIIPAKFRLDAAHIAMASINNLDYVLSYNFQHINRAKTKLMTERINRELGYGTILICTAKEVLDDE